jgi:excisionase family DNA binding protein
MQDDTRTLTLMVEEAARVLGISRALAYEAARNGDIPTIRIGRRLLVPRMALDRLLSASVSVSPDADAHSCRPNRATSSTGHGATSTNEVSGFAGGDDAWRDGDPTQERLPVGPVDT